MTEEGEAGTDRLRVEHLSLLRQVSSMAEAGRKTRLRGADVEREVTRVEVPELRVVSDDLWNAAHARIAATAKELQQRGKLIGKASSTHGVYMLSGLLACGLCGSKLVATARGRNNRHVFICSANREKGANVCANHSGVPMDLLEIGIVKTLRESLTPEALAAYVAEREADTSKRDSNARERQQLLDTIGKLQGQEAKLADLIVESSAPAALVTKLKGLQAERETAEARLVEVEDEGRDLHADAALVGRLQAELPDWLDALTSDPASAKAKLRSILATPVAVTPHGSGRDTVWSFEGMSRLDGSLSGSVAHDGAVSRMEAPSAGGPCS